MRRHFFAADQKNAAAPFPTAKTPPILAARQFD
jgi:hypothetical protein